MAEETIVFNKGALVPENGLYVCSPCGFKKEHKAGDVFTECTSCLAGTEDGDPKFINGTGLWEKVDKAKEK